MENPAGREEDERREGKGREKKILLDYEVNYLPTWTWIFRFACQMKNQN